MDNCLLFVADTCHSAVILPPPSLLAEALLIIEAKMLDPFFPSFLSSYGMSMGKVRPLTSGTWQYVAVWEWDYSFWLKETRRKRYPFSLVDLVMSPSDAWNCCSQPKAKDWDTSDVLMVAEWKGRKQWGHWWHHGATEITLDLPCSWPFYFMR